MSHVLGRGGAALLAAVLLLAPRLAQACAMCVTGREDETRSAFLVTTFFMSVLPIGGLVLAVWWLRRRFRELDRQDDEARRAALPASPRLPAASR